jgi:hypothetical protein
MNRELPQAIADIPFRLCQECGEGLVKAGASWWCEACCGYRTPCPNAEQIEQAIAALRPLGKGDHAYDHGSRPKYESTGPGIREITVPYGIGKAEY